jgi:hypothetical protein
MLWWYKYTPHTYTAHMPPPPHFLFRIKLKAAAPPPSTLSPLIPTKRQKIKCFVYYFWINAAVFSVDALYTKKRLAEKCTNKFIGLSCKYTVWTLDNILTVYGLPV